MNEWNLRFWWFLVWCILKIIYNNWPRVGDETLTTIGISLNDTQRLLFGVCKFKSSKNGPPFSWCVRNTFSTMVISLIILLVWLSISFDISSLIVDVIGIGVAATLDFFVLFFLRMLPDFPFSLLRRDEMRWIRLRIELPRLRLYFVW